MDTRRHPLLASLALTAACACAVVAIFGAWAQAQLLDTNEWVHTSGRLLDNRAVERATAHYLEQRLVNSPTAQAILKRELPPSLAPLSPFLNQELGRLATHTAQVVMRTNAFRALWRQTNRVAHRQFVVAVEGNENVVTQGIALDLRPEIRILAKRIGVPPQSVLSRGVITVLAPENLATARDGVRFLRTVRWLSLVLAIVLLLVGALSFARKPLGVAGAGTALVVAGAVVLVGRNLAGSFAVDRAVGAGPNRPAANATWNISTTLLGNIALETMAGGAVLVLVGLAVAAVRRREM